MVERRSVWSQWGIILHLAIVAVSGYLLVVSHSWTARAGLAIVSGTSLFVLTGLIHEASHHLLVGRTWYNEVLGNLSGVLLLTPLTAYRAFHLKHHQTTNRDDDPNRPLNSRWMLLLGSLCYVLFIHFYAWRHLRGSLLARYVLEVTAAMGTIIVVVLLPHSVRDRAILAPLAVVCLLQNIRIVSEHLDLPAGKYHDTWQLALPKWLSVWVLHYDHHLEHHLRPGLHWHELPAYRNELIRSQPALAARRVTLAVFFQEVFLARSSISSPRLAERAG